MPNKKTNYLPLILLPIIIVLCFGLWWVDKAPVQWGSVESDTGVFDMRDIDFHSTIISTSRTVEYIPDELLTPEEFALRDDIKVGRVPDETKICTMRVRYLVPDNINYGIGGYSVNYASSVYVGGEWIFDAGKPAQTLEDEESTEAFYLFSAQPVDGVIEILIQTSAFANVDTSSGMQWYIGEYNLVRVHHTRTIAQDITVMSCYIVLALVALLLFFALPSYKATGWLSLLSLVWAVRVGLKSRKILLTLFPEHTWEFVFKTEIITSPLTILLLALVLHSVFTVALPKWFTAAIIGGSAATALAVVVLPWPTFLGHSVWSNPPIYWSLAVSLLVILFSLWRTKTKPTLSQIIILVGMGLVVFSFMWDEDYFRHHDLPFTVTQPMMLAFTVFMLVATMLDTMRKTVRREVELAHKIDVQEKELLESRFSAILSQIQPHFLFNSLEAIQDLCEQEDAAQSENAVKEFSKYLRINLDSITYKKPIAFTKELGHTKIYLSLEQKRFEERLQIVFDIQTTNFRIPALTLQPIVENAVRHGVTKRDEGGVITIRTTEESDRCVVTIEDNGVGFSPDAPMQDGKNHIGIKSVRHRLESMSSGTLEIHSTPGVGTVATITIPKGGEVA